MVVALATYGVLLGYPKHPRLQAASPAQGCKQRHGPSLYGMQGTAATPGSPNSPPSVLLP